MIGIIVALNSEAKTFKDIIENKTAVQLADKKGFVGKIDGKDVALFISGIGKVNAALTAQAVIDAYSPDYVINFGTAGGMNSNVEIMKYYIIDKCCQYDFDVSVLDNVPVGYIQDFNGIYFNCYTEELDFLPFSNVASGDRFNNDLNDIGTINGLNCSLRDMECGAIGQVCTSNNVPLIAIKGVSDVFGSGTAEEQFVKNLNDVSNGFKDIIKKVIRVLSCK